MAKFPTEVERRVVARVPLARAYSYLLDVGGTSKWIPSIARCEKVDAQTWRFISKERSVGPLSLGIRYTARYEGNGVDHISFRSVEAEGDNAEIEGTLALRALADGTTEIHLHQRIAPDTPVPRLMQGMLRSFVEREASSEVDSFLEGVRRTLEGDA